MSLTTKPAYQISMAVILCMAGCGGGAGSSSPTANSLVQPATGVFLDSPVKGLHFDTATQHGDTDVVGSFTYLPGETITFSIGNIKFDPIAAKGVITPLDVAGTSNVADQRVTNMLVLLQSLDIDGVASDGITIPVRASSLAPSAIDFDVPSSTFRTNAVLTGFVSAATSTNRALVSNLDATIHFQYSLNAGIGNGRINIAPFASAGVAQTVVQGTSVNLGGSASSDANGDAITYQWRFVSKPVGSSAALSGANTVSPTFVPDVAGDYLLGLVVNDGALSSPLSVVKVSVAPSTGVPSGYALVWSDEFNTSGAQLPDPNKWGYDISQNSVGWYNGELEYYSNGRIENSVVQNSRLFITARKENLSSIVSDWGGQSYTSARLFTKGKWSWTYGFFEIRAKLPCGAGTWPAIWTLGSTVNVWPDQGEIDIMEQTGWDKGNVLGTVHTLAGYGGNGSTGSTAVPDACTAFHNYQIKWTANAIDFYVDGVTYRPSYVKPASAAGWPFDNPQYLLLNVAVGGNLGGAVNDATLSNTSLEVDYVRVYQAQ